MLLETSTLKALTKFLFAHVPNLKWKRSLLDLLRRATQDVPQEDSTDYAAENAVDGDSSTSAVSKEEWVLWFKGQMSERFSAIKLHIHGY